jgi:hypothetical protein
MPELSQSLVQRSDFHSDTEKSKNEVDNESRSRLAMEMLSPRGGALEGTIRATTVLAGGLMDGVTNGVTRAADNKLNTAATVAETFAVGYGLGAVSKMGKLGAPIAAIGGLSMGAAWVYSEFSAGRPQNTINAVNDAYHSGANLEANRKKVADNGGAILFDVALAGTAGGLGLKSSMGLKNNWHLDAIQATKTQFGKHTEFLSAEPAAMARSFAGKEVKTGEVFDQVRDIVASKPKATGSFADLQLQLKKSQLLDDAHLVGVKEKLSSVHQENLTLAASETQLSGKLVRQVKEKEVLSGPLPEKAQLTSAQESLRSAEEVGRTINARRQEHDRLFREKEEARTRMSEAKPESNPQADRQAFEQKNEAFREAKSAFEEAKSQGGPEAIARAKQRVADAETSLKAAEQARPDKLTAVEQQIKTTEAELTLVRQQRTQLSSTATELVGAHQKRLAELELDPSKLVKVEKVAEAKPVVEPKAVVEKAPDKIAETVAVPAQVVQPLKFEPTNASLAKLDLGTPEAVVKPAVAQPEVVKVEVAKVEVAKVEPAKPEIVEVAKVEPAKSSELIKLSPEAELARSNAHSIVEANKLVREIEVSRKTIAEIDSNTYRARPGEVVAETRARAEQNVRDVQKELGGDRGPSYTRALKVVSQYAKAVSKELAQIPDSNKRGMVAAESVVQLESMMNGLPNSYKGYREKLADLREPGRGVNNGSPEKRLSEIQEHLELKTRLLDETRNRQLHDIAETQPVLKEILERQSKGTLPEDGTIVLFGKNGKFINQPGTRSPHFIEISRLNEHGVGADGAGFNRFTNNLADIDGMVVLKPIYENGQRVQLNTKSTSGRPVYKKMVADTFGNIPPEIAVADNFVKILDKFGPERQANR